MSSQTEPACAAAPELGSRPPADRLAWLSLLLVVVLVPLTPAGSAAFPWKPYVLLALALAGGGCVCLSALRGRTAPALGTPVDGWWLAFAATALPAAAVAGNVGAARFELGLVLAQTLVFVLALKTVRTPRDARTLLLAALGTAAVVALVGLRDHRRFLLAALPEEARSAALATPFFAHSYLAAQDLVPVLAGGLVLLLDGGALRPRTRLLVATALAPIGAYLLVVGSRGAWLATLAGLGLSLALLLGAARGARPALLRLLRAALLLVLGAGLVLVLLAFTGLLVGAADYALDRALQLLDPELRASSVSRLSVWRAALSLWSDRPLLGMGLGNFAAELPGRLAGAGVVTHAHQQFLHVLAERGLVGLLPLLLLVGAGVHAARKGAHALAADDERRPLLHALVAALGAALVGCLFETPLAWPESGSLIALLLALLTRAGCLSREAPARRGLAAAGLVAALLVLAFSAPAWIGLARASLPLRHAEEALARGQVAAALDDLAAADQLCPWRLEALGLAVAVLVEHDQPEAALEVLDRSLARRPGGFDELGARGRILMELGRPAEAVEPLRAAVSAHRGRGSEETYAALGRALLQVGRYEEAWGVFADLVGVHHYEQVRPSILLDAANALLQLDRDLHVAQVLLGSYRQLVPPGDRQSVGDELAAQIERQLARPRRAPER